MTTTKNWSYLDGKTICLSAAGIPEAGHNMETFIDFDNGMYTNKQARRGHAKVMGDRSGQMHILQLQRIEDVSIKR